MSDEHDAEFGLVMPFVVCASQGGPYEDNAFVAGWELGRLDAELAIYAALGFGSLSRMAHAGSIPQIDLVAMKHGYRLTHYSDEQDGWVNYDLDLLERDT